MAAIGGAGPGTPQSLLLRDATLWDGVSPGPHRHADVLIEGGAIQAVLPSGRTGGDTRGKRMVDLDGAFLMPGLIDMHVHLVWSGSFDPVPVVADEGEQLTTLRAMANSQRHLMAGVTTVRDLGGNWDIPIAVARAIERGYVLGPRVVAAGKTIIITGGHDPFWGIPSDGPTAVVAAVRRQVSLGAGVIKVSATGGVYGRPEGEEIGQAELGYDELAAVAAESHKFGLKVTAHALGSEGIRDSVHAGIDTIEHGHFLDEGIVQEMKKRGTSLCPTVLTYKNIAQGGAGNIPAYAVQKAQRSLKAHRESFLMAIEAGIPIVAGTDAGSPDLPHPSLVDELRVMCEYGMAIDEALLAATRTAAQVLGRASQLGTVEPGKIADLVVLDESPLDDLDALRGVRHVIRSGALLEPAQLRASTI